MFVLRNQLPQIFHLGESEGNGLLVLAEEFGGTADGDCGSPRHRGQAVPATGIANSELKPTLASQGIDKNLAKRAQRVGECNFRGRRD